jgi:ATP-dependent Clp protease protease subunit
MIHGGSGGFRGTPSDAKIHMREWEEILQALYAILSTHTGQPIDRIIADTDRDKFMSPEQAKAYGIIDAVYASPGDSMIAQAHSGPGPDVISDSSTGPGPATA